jgi:transcriptional regulator with XRE-family HTH domain
MPNIQTNSADDIEDETPNPAVIAEQLRTFGKNLRAARKALKLKQAEVAAQADELDRAGLSKIECGKRAPNHDTVARLCTALAIDREQLMQGIGPADSPRRPLTEEERTSSTPAEILGANLRWAREQADAMTQEALANDSGVDFTTISRIENGHGDPNTRTVLRLAHTLGTAPGVLVHGT